MEKWLKYLTIIFFILIIFYIFLTAYFKHDDYAQELKLKTGLIVEGRSAPRGKIYDVNGKILVDNVTTNDVVFHYLKGMDVQKIIEKLDAVLEFEEGSNKDLAAWYKFTYDEEKLLTKKEKALVEERKIDEKEKEKIIEQKILSLSFSSKEKREAKIYASLMSGYLYETKIIQKDVSDEVVYNILQANIPGVTIETGFKRHYSYGDVLKEIFGSVGMISKEAKSEYLDSGYSLSDEVGVSYLEKYYDAYLKGTKAKYLVEDDYSLTLLEEEKKGNDLYLSIDIDLQLELEKTVENALSAAKKSPNTEYLNDTYAIVAEPNTGAIKAIAGKRYLKEATFNDIIVGNISSSFTMGSVVKGATISVGYKYDLINPSQKILDGCVKLYSQTAKCSHESLGYIDSVTALKYSSNYYQFLIAIALTGKTYVPNMTLGATEKEFAIYREMLSSYGLGGKTGIDLPNEQTGIEGKIISDDLLLNLTIGQYDTYTPMQLITYINTIASGGYKRSPSLVQKIVFEKKVIYQNEYAPKSKVDLEAEELALIQKGFSEVMKSDGTGMGFINYDYKPAGKTGTSESFYDANNDGKVDTSTLTLTLAAYFPYDNPQYSLAIVSPNASHNNSSLDYIYYITAKISREITDFLFENMVIP